MCHMYRNWHRESEEEWRERLQGHVDFVCAYASLIFFLCVCVSVRACTCARFFDTDLHRSIIQKLNNFNVSCLNFFSRDT